MHSRHAYVESGDFDARTFVLDRPSPFGMSEPVVVAGHAMAVVDQYENEIAVEEAAPCDPGDCIRQTIVTTKVSEVLAAFRAEWEPRWNRMDHLADGQWDQIIGFAQNTLSPIDWTMPDITQDQFCRASAAKKRAAAIGPDGVSRYDLIRLGKVVGPGMVELYRHAELTGCWPRQLTHGVVSVLAKVPEAQTVRDYRPVVVYPLPYRVWSSIRGRQLLQALDAVRPNGMRGGMPRCQSKSVWYEMAVLLEASHTQRDSLLGIVADLEKAFNGIPRMPIWAALHALQCPPALIRGWGGFCQCPGPMLQGEGIAWGSHSQYMWISRGLRPFGGCDGSVESSA